MITTADHESGRPTMVFVDPLKCGLAPGLSGGAPSEAASEGQQDPVAFQTRTVHELEELRPLVENLAERLIAICLDAEIGAQGLAPLIRLVRSHRPATPIFILFDAEKGPSLPFSEADLKRLSVQGALPRHSSMEDLLKPLEGLGAFIREFDSLAKAESDLRESREDHHFFPILADEFMTGTPVFLDIFVRLGSGHYVKVLRKGEGFSADQLLKFLRKGVDRFYGRKIERERYLEYCDRLSSRTLELPAASDLKIERALRYGEAAAHFLRESGVGEEQLKHAFQYVDRVEKAARNAGLDSNELFKRFRTAVEHYEHGVSCALITAFLCQQMKIERGLATEVVGLAALLHDIGLYSMPASCQSEDESRMSASEIELYRTHPKVGADILRATQGIEASVIQIVEQHHERRNLMGFPRHQGVGRVNPLAEIVAISDELANLILAAAKTPTIRPLEVMQSRVFPGFSPAVTRAFHDLFYTTLL